MIERPISKREADRLVRRERRLLIAAQALWQLKHDKERVPKGSVWDRVAYEKAIEHALDQTPHQEEVV